MSTDSSAVRPRPRAASARSLWPPPREAWFAVSCVALLFAGHWLYGALVNDTAFVLEILAALLVGVVLLMPRLRDDLLRLRALRLPAIAFGLTLAVGAWTLTPWTPGGPHPVWAYEGLGLGASTIDRSSTIAELIKLMGLGCFFLAGAAVGGHDARARFAVRSTIIAGLALGLWAFIGTMTGALVTADRRLEAHFLNANTAGTLFAMLALLALAEAQTERGGSGQEKLTARLPALVAAATFVVCVIATLSRGAIAALFLGGIADLFLLLASGRLKPTRLLLGGLAGLAAVALALIVSGGHIFDRFALAGEEAALRTEVWKAHWQAFLASPLFGYGLGTSETVNKTLITVANFPELVIIRGVLNVYLQWLEQAGLIGAVPMFATIGLVLRRTFTGTLRRNRSRAVLCALLACDVVVLAHGTTDFGLEVYSMAAMWAWLLGLQFGLAQGSSAR